MMKRLLPVLTLSAALVVASVQPEAHVMQVHATPSTGSLSGSVLSFSGSGRLILDGNQQLDVHVCVWADSATQKFQLTVVEVGTMPVETMISGQFTLA